MSLIEIGKIKTFTIDEANELIPLVTSITRKHELAVTEALKKQRWFLQTGANPDLIKLMDEEVKDQLSSWAKKLGRLGLSAFQQGYVGFDSGSFYYSWHLNEPIIEYYHYYFELPTSRRKLSTLQLIVGPSNAE